MRYTPGLRMNSAEPGFYLFRDLYHARIWRRHSATLRVKIPAGTMIRRGWTILENYPTINARSIIVGRRVTSGEIA